MMPWLSHSTGWSTPQEGVLPPYPPASWGQDEFLWRTLRFWWTETNWTECCIRMRLVFSWDTFDRNSTYINQSFLPFHPWFDCEPSTEVQSGPKGVRRLIPQPGRGRVRAGHVAVETERAESAHWANSCSPTICHADISARQTRWASGWRWTSSSPGGNLEWLHDWSFHPPQKLHFYVTLATKCENYCCEKELIWIIDQLLRSY